MFNPIFSCTICVLCKYLLCIIILKLSMNQKPQIFVTCRVVQELPLLHSKVDFNQLCVRLRQLSLLCYHSNTFAAQDEGWRGNGRLTICEIATIATRLLFLLKTTMIVIDLVPADYTMSRSLGTLRAPTSSWGPFGPQLCPSRPSGAQASRLTGR